MSLSDTVRAACEELLGGQAIKQLSNVGGGDINEAYRIETADGAYFVKLNQHTNGLDMLAKEALALERLQAFVETPQVVAYKTVDGWNMLLMRYVPEGKRTTAFWQDFGAKLAYVHQQSHEYFGLDHNNYLGYLPQLNTYTNTWASFYVENRLKPQVRMAFDRQLLWTNAYGDFENLYSKIEQICPVEPPSLIHGDLWGGNFLTSKEGTCMLIDPAIAYAHREMDIAMSRLFGGFSHLFYEAYQESFPTEPGLEKRLDIYQLYYLLAHVNLFGRSYTGSVQQIVQRYI